MPAPILGAFAVAILVAGSAEAASANEPRRIYYSRELQPSGSSGGSFGSTDYDYCDMCGADATYAETVAGDKREVVTNGCPNHYAVCTGKDGAAVSDGGTCGAVRKLRLHPL